MSIQRAQVLFICSSLAKILRETFLFRFNLDFLFCIAAFVLTILTLPGDFDKLMTPVSLIILQQRCTVRQAKPSFRSWNIFRG